MCKTINMLNKLKPKRSKDTAAETNEATTETKEVAPSTAQPETETKLPSYITDSAVQTYDIPYKNWKSTKALVNDVSTGTTLYELDVPTIFRSKVLMRTANDDAEIGHCQSSLFKSTLKAELRGQALELQLKKRFSSDYTYASPAFGGATMTWTFHSGWSDIYYVLLDEQSLPVARWTARGPSIFTNLGKVEFLGTKAESQEAREEIFLTGLTLIYIIVTSRSTSV
ncbi:hypothetical protein BDY17DRAFT_293928 [Neohortaea acidophila]|uniref:Tubby C-terminal-like domain-containing protein n=1 Tax=Neohortaea acidophila TaxID=245834 RepID=A0A6A6PZY1_9PEZI|nr:uncharacterized protein BDY17DRAFT_293928 [Neohortaea acidophila]KAF2485585.1 hypothetical protein BDY17DRAFT_293928 [Neohortaea acidophila]